MAFDASILQYSGGCALGKPFQISKREVWDAWLKVRENQGAPGVDGQSIEEFEADWAALAEGLDHIPPLPPEAFSREAMYADHD